MPARMRTLFAECRTKKDYQKVANFTVWLEEHKCKHGHPYTAHPKCYDKEHPDTKYEERIGFLDIECSNLKADFGIVLSWCLLPEKGRCLSGVITQDDVKSGLYDKRIIEELLRKLSLFDRVVTHYGDRFDIPFLRTRAIRHKLDRELIKPLDPQGLWHTDMWKISRSKLCISSNRQDAMSRALGVPDIKTRIHPELWLDVQMRQDKKGLKYILDHNLKDVIQLRDNFNEMRPHIVLGKTSI